MRYVRATEVAKLVRTHLRKNWDGKGPGNPDGWTFSVRTDKWSGGASVRVTVPASFPETARRNLALELMSWGGQGFDGMTDSTYGKSHTLCAEHGVTLTSVAQHFGALETSTPPCCDAAEPVHMFANTVHVSRAY